MYSLDFMYLFVFYYSLYEQSTNFEINKWNQENEIVNLAMAIRANILSIISSGKVRSSTVAIVISLFSINLISNKRNISVNQRKI